MSKWMVCDSRMNVVGFVYADNYTSAFIEARSRFGYVEYIQEV